MPRSGPPEASLRTKTPPRPGGGAGDRTHGASRTRRGRPSHAGQAQGGEELAHARELGDAEAELDELGLAEVLEGVVDQRHGSYRLQLTEKLGAITQAPRPAPPTVPGDRRIAGFNVLNLFNGDGAGGGFPTERGAASADEYARQQAKLIAVVQALDPDLAALMEIENDGYGPASSLAQFVAPVAG